MKRILIVSGPPCSGKTYLINQWEKFTGDLNLIFDDFHPPYDFFNANQVRQNSGILKKNTIVHYDCLRSYKRGKNYIDESDIFLKYLKTYKNISRVILIINPINILYERMKERYSRLESNISNSRKAKIEKLLDLYSNQSDFITNYLLWYQYLLDKNHIDIELYLNGFDNITKFFIGATESNIVDLLSKQSNR